jgi:hypothetical protein
MELDDQADSADIERRLAGWRPEADGLNPDAMLFAAGRATRQSSRYWPFASAIFAALAIGLGIWGFGEREGRLALIRNHDRRSTPIAAPPDQAPARADPANTPSPTGFWSMRRTFEEDPDRWMTARAPESPNAAVPPSGQAILTVRSDDSWLDQ